MFVKSENIRPLISNDLCRLLDDLLSLANGTQLIFLDEKEFTIKTGKSLYLSDGEACLTGSPEQLIICLKSLDSITQEIELSIAHELGHMWLRFHDFPCERMYRDPIKQQYFDICFGPLLEIMEHFIFFPWLNDLYKINLYERENQRLANFIRNEFPKRKVESDQISFILNLLNYIKFNLQSDNKYWQDKLRTAYRKKGLINLCDTAETVMSIIRKLSRNSPNKANFLEKYSEVLEVLNIRSEIWPDFLT